MLLVLSFFCVDNSSVSGLILKYKEQEEMLEVKLTVVPSPEEHRKQSLTWLAAMQKVSDQCLNSLCNIASIVTSGGPREAPPPPPPPSPVFL